MARLPPASCQVQAVSTQELHCAHILGHSRQDVQQAPGPLYLSDLVGVACLTWWVLPV